jgi:hypothetical protein
MWYFRHSNGGVYLREDERSARLDAQATMENLRRNGSWDPGQTMELGELVPRGRVGLEPPENDLTRLRAEFEALKVAVLQLTEQLRPPPQEHPLMIPGEDFEGELTAAELHRMTGVRP